MSRFTFEENFEAKLETYEWDNIWWEHTENKEAKRILYVGDSISCGTRHAVTAVSGEKILCDGFGTSKAVDNSCFIPALELCLKQITRCDAILFNNGLHGWHLSGEEYEKYYDIMLKFFKETGLPVFVLLTTDFYYKPDGTKTVVERNEIAVKLAEKYNFPVIDLFGCSVKNKELYSEDGVHLTGKGYEKLAECILEVISDKI